MLFINFSMNVIFVRDKETAEKRLNDRKFFFLDNIYSNSKISRAINLEIESKLGIKVSKFREIKEKNGS